MSDPSQLPHDLFRDQADQEPYRRIDLCGGLVIMEGESGIAGHAVTMRGHGETG